MKPMKARPCIQIVAPLLLLGGLGTACSLKPYGDTARVSIDLSAVSSPSPSQAFLLPSLGHSSAYMGTVPSSVDGFSCYFVNVMGSGISSQYSDKAAGLPDPYCDYPGVTSSFIGGTDSAIELKVPAGPARKIQVIGVLRDGGCRLGTTFEEMKMDWTYELHELGSSTADLFGDATVTVQNKYDASLASLGQDYPFMCHPPTSATPISMSGPMSVSGLAFWADASTITGVADGSSMSGQVWYSMGPGFTHTGAVSGPVYYHAADGSIGGRPSVEFATGGIVDFGNPGDLDAILSATTPTYTVFAVAMATVSTGGTVFAKNAQSTSNYGPEFSLVNGGGGLVTPQLVSQDSGGGSIEQVSGTTPFSTSVYKVMTASFDGYQTPYANRIEIYLGGSPQGKNMIYDQGGLPTGSIPANVTMGSRSGGGNTLYGRVAEVLLYNRILTAAEIATISSYLGSKYGI